MLSTHQQHVVKSCLTRFSIQMRFKSSLTTIVSLLPSVTYTTYISSIDNQWSMNTLYSENTNSIHVTVNAIGSINNWVGFGISPTGGMIGSDLVMGYVNVDGTFSCDTYYANEHGQPMKNQVSAVSNETVKLINMDGKSYIQMEFNYPVQAINGLRNSINIAHPNSVIYAIGSRAGSSLSKHTTSGNILFSIGSNFTVYSPTPPSPTTTELVHVVTPTPEPLKPLIMSPDGRWTLHHKVSDIKNLLHIVVDAEAEITEWIGFGVSPTGAMDGSSMVIGWFNNDGSANISHYKGLSDQAPIRDTVSEVKSISMSSSNGRVQMEFLYPINSSETVKNPIRYNDKNQFLYAIGQKSGDRLLNHRRKGLLFVDFETGDVWNSLMLKKLHAIFMILGWVLIVPISILLARFGRVKFDSWFRLHQALQFSALILIIGSFIIILYKNKLYISNPHAMLGIIVLSLGAIAVLLGSFSYYTRNPGKTLHWFDDKLHWWVGRTAALLAILNVVIGIKFYTASMISFLVSIVWFIIYIGVWIYLEVKIGEQQSVVIEELDHTTMNLSDSDPSLPISIEDAKPDEGKSKLSKDKVLIIFLIVHIGCVSVMVLSTWTSFDV